MPGEDVRFKIPHTYVSSLSILTYPLSPHSPSLFITLQNDASASYPTSTP